MSELQITPARAHDVPRESSSRSRQVDTTKDKDAPAEAVAAAPAVTAPPQGSVRVPAPSRTAPFVWVIVTLMVGVTSYVAYELATTPAASSASEQPASLVASSRASSSLAATPRDSDSRGAQAEIGAPAAPPPTPAAHATNVTNAAAATPPARKTARTNTAAAAQTASAAERAEPLPPDTETRPQASADYESTVAAAAAATVRDPADHPDDRWQRMAADIAGCAQGAGLGAVICEQKVRIRYCEGWWGRADQCRNKFAEEHGS